MRRYRHEIEREMEDVQRGHRSPRDVGRFVNGGYERERATERLGEEVMEMGASPMPKSDTSTNCPGSCPKFRPSGSSMVNTFSNAVICFTLVRQAILGV